MALITTALASLGSSPGFNSSTNIWPVQNRKNMRVAKGVSGRAIGASRSNGDRTHVGIDLFANHGDVVVAVADGTIVSFKHFYRGTYALLIDHGSYVVNYGEVARESLTLYGLKTPRFRDKVGRRLVPSFSGWVESGHPLASRYPWVAASGSSVKRGQPIARIQKMFTSSMLHFEMYESGTIDTKRWRGFNTSAPSGILNPTDFLASASFAASAGILPKAEEPSRDVCR